MVHICDKKFKHDSELYLSAQKSNFYQKLDRTQIEFDLFSISSFNFRIGSAHLSNIFFIVLFLYGSGYLGVHEEMSNRRNLSAELGGASINAVQYDIFDFAPLNSFLLLELYLKRFKIGLTRV